MSIFSRISPMQRDVLTIQVDHPLWQKYIDVLHITEADLTLLEPIKHAISKNAETIYAICLEKLNKSLKLRGKRYMKAVYK